MKSLFPIRQGGPKYFKPVSALSVTLVAVALGSCSADVSRFDSSSFALNDPPETGSAPPTPAEPVYGGYGSPAASATPRGPYGAGAKSVEMAALPDATPAGSAYSPPPSYSPPPAYNSPPSRPYTPRSFGHAQSEPTDAKLPRPRSNVPIAKGEQIEIKPGDTLYRLSRSHGVSVSGLMQVNNLSTPALKPGQKIYLPVEGGASVASAPSAMPSVRPSPSTVAAERAVEAATPAAAPMSPVEPEVAARYGGSYTVKPGESLYSIAKNHKVLFSELQRVNGISDPRRVKPGMVLKVPGASEAAPVASTGAGVVPPLASTEPSHFGSATTTQPSVINGERKVAALNDRANDASPVATPPKADEKVATAASTASPAAFVDSVKLRWPATGRVIEQFGGRADGTHNDGINLAVPLGTEVHAAESGVVAYAGSELKGYGNLVLLRHDNGWVTAYAHNDELLVKRGDKIKRGQVIAKAGKTGSVDQPQVHFELRQGSKPVDPIPFLEKS